MARKQLQNLTEPMYYILLSMQEPVHGYGIMKKIDEITAGRVKVGAGTLYALLSRFEKEGIIRITSSEDSKKNYIITDKGQKLLHSEYTRLLQLVKDGAIALGGDMDEEEN